jgi:hypothetical protein
VRRIEHQSLTRSLHALDGVDHSIRWAHARRVRRLVFLALLALGCGSEVPFPPSGGGIPPIIGGGGSGGSGVGGAGGVGGSGGTSALCVGVDCSDGNDCTQDVCDSADGTCSNPDEADQTACDFVGGPGICASGTCVDGTLCNNMDCSDGNQCTQDVCDPVDGSCSNPAEANGTACTVGGISGTCSDGVCAVSP